jgi:RNA polymerase sigma-70 factor (ECF subfamily)
VRAAVSGDAEAFASLYALVYKDLYHIALYSLKNQSDAEDAVSEAILDAFSSIRKLKDENAFKAWLMKILSVKIKRKFKEYYKSGQSLPAGIVFAPENSGLPESLKTEINYDIIDIKQEFEQLDVKDRFVLSLSVVGGYTSKEIAKFSGMNENTVRSRIARAKEKIKSKLNIDS